MISYHAGATLINTVSGSRGVQGSSELLATKPSSKRKISSFKSIFKISQSQTGYKLLLEKANSEFYYSTSSLFLQKENTFLHGGCTVTTRPWPSGLLLNSSG